VKSEELAVVRRLRKGRNGTHFAKAEEEDGKGTAHGGIIWLEVDLSLCVVTTLVSHMNGFKKT